MESRREAHRDEERRGPRDTKAGVDVAVSTPRNRRSRRCAAPCPRRSAGAVDPVREPPRVGGRGEEAGPPPAFTAVPEVVAEELSAIGGHKLTAHLEIRLADTTRAYERDRYFDAQTILREIRAGRPWGRGGTPSSTGSRSTGSATGRAPCGSCGPSRT